MLSQRRMTVARTYLMETDVRWRGENESTAGVKAKEALAFSSSGWRDVTTPAAKNSQETFSLSVGAYDPKVFKGEHVKLGNAHFLNFKKIPDAIGPLHFAEYRDRWLRLELASLLKETTIPLFGGTVPDLNEKARAELAEQFRRTPFLSVAEQLKSEIISDASTHHYKVTPEILFVKDYYISAEQARLGRDLTGKERLAADAFFANLSPEDGEIWIGKRNFFLYRIRMRFNYDNGIRKGVLDVTVNFSHFNEPPSIAGPTSEVEDVTPLISSLVQGFKEHLPMAKEGLGNRSSGASQSSGLGTVTDFISPGQEDPDQDGLSNSLEAFYGTDRNNADTDGDGMNDGDEVDQGRNPSGAGKLFDFTGGQFD
jgi:hypothetical protein